MEASARAPEDLYGLPLEEFTPARDALARELKAAGRKDEAAEVKSLRKPTLAAWALNRAARDHPDAIEQLRAAGADLRAAQDEALSGDAGRLREAGRALSDEIDRVGNLAADALRDAGRPATAAQQEKLAGTLRTAAIDAAAGAVLARGVLVDDLDATGFTLLASGSGDLSTPASSSARKAKAGKKPSKDVLEAVEAARRELRRCDAEADMAATRARRKAERAEAAAKRAAEAQREADEARAAAEDAAGEAEAARRRAAEAADALTAAEAAPAP